MTGTTVYIYIYIEREREKDRGREGGIGREGGGGREKEREIRITQDIHSRERESDHTSYPLQKNRMSDQTDLVEVNHEG